MMTFEAQRQMLSMPVAAATPMEMLGRALQMGAPPETLERLLALQERWEANQGRKEFDNAMALARAEFDTITKRNKANYGSGKAAYQYEDLAEIERAILPALSKYGINYRFRSAVLDGQIVMTCILSKEGYREESSIPGPVDTSGSKNPLQAIGSGLTYLQRYSLRIALGLAPARDDDARAAHDTKAPPYKLTAQQVVDLDAAIVASGRTVEWFLGFAQINELSDLAPERFVAALNFVNKLPKAKVDDAAKD